MALPQSPWLTLNSTFRLIGKRINPSSEKSDVRQSFIIDSKRIGGLDRASAIYGQGMANEAVSLIQLLPWQGYGVRLVSGCVTQLSNCICVGTIFGA